MCNVNMTIYQAVLTSAFLGSGHWVHTSERNQPGCHPEPDYYLTTCHQPVDCGKGLESHGIPYHSRLQVTQQGT